MKNLMEGRIAAALHPRGRILPTERLLHCVHSRHIVTNPCDIGLFGYDKTIEQNKAYE